MSNMKLAPPASYEDFILNKNLYPTEPYTVPETTSTYKNMKFHEGLFLLVGTENIGLWGTDKKPTYQEYVPLLDFCTVTGERYETIKELMDALMLRNTEQNHISGINRNGKLYLNTEVMAVELLEFGLTTFDNVEVITLATCWDLLVRLGRVQKPTGWLG